LRAGEWRAAAVTAGGRRRPTHARDRRNDYQRDGERRGTNACRMRLLRRPRDTGLLARRSCIARIRTLPSASSARAPRPREPASSVHRCTPPVGGLCFGFARSPGTAKPRQRSAGRRRSVDFMSQTPRQTRIAG
jgi:hypothetical protein